MFPVANEATFGPPNAEESRYASSFLVCNGLHYHATQTHIMPFHQQDVDLTSNFYYSYTYDLTRPLQNNMHIPTPEEGMA